MVGTSASMIRRRALATLWGAIRGAKRQETVPQVTVKQGKLDMLVGEFSDAYFGSTGHLQCRHSHHPEEISSCLALGGVIL